MRVMTAGLSMLDRLTSRGQTKKFCDYHIWNREFSQDSVTDFGIPVLLLGVPEWKKDEEIKNDLNQAGGPTEEGIIFVQ